MQTEQFNNLLTGKDAKWADLLKHHNSMMQQLFSATKIKMKKLFLITSVLLIASCTNTGTHSVTVTDSNIVIKKQTDTTIHVIVDTVKEK